MGLQACLPLGNADLFETSFLHNVLCLRGSGDLFADEISSDFLKTIDWFPTCPLRNILLPMFLKRKLLRTKEQVLVIRPRDGGAVAIKLLRTGHIKFRDHFRAGPELPCRPSFI
jgi:hypothetical protein